MSEFTEVLEALEGALSSGEPLALATVVSARGSTYRRPGARRVIRADGSTSGAISGGCVEEEIAGIAEEVIRTGEPRFLEVDHSEGHDEHLGWGLGCRGVIEVLVEPASTAKLVAEAMRTSLGATVILSTDPVTGEHVVGVSREGWFVEVLEPPPTLLICGSGPEAAPLSRAAAAIGWTVSEIAAPQALPAVTGRSFAVVCSHDFEKDGEFLRALAGSPAGYVGLLGPRSRAERLAEELAVDVSRLHAPAGLDIGAETPEEIALSVLAEMVAVVSGRSGDSLRDRRGPIH